MKTIVIYDQCGQERLTFYVIKSNKSLQKFNDCFVNMDLPKGVKQKDFDRLMDLIHDGKLKKLTVFPVDEFDDDTEVITVGCPP